MAPGATVSADALVEFQLFMEDALHREPSLAPTPPAQAGDVLMIDGGALRRRAASEHLPCSMRSNRGRPLWLGGPGPWSRSFELGESSPLVQ